MEWLLPYGTALLLGSVHAFEADHVVAVTAFAVRRRHPLDGIRFGLRWAVGHGFVIVAAGALLTLAGVDAPESVVHVLERGVGVALIFLGFWTVAGARSLHAHGHTHVNGTRHAHLHSHLFGRGHDHGHGVTLVGMMHGLAGTAPVVALIPLAAAGSVTGGIAYLLLFAVGTAAGMALYGLVAGLIANRAVARSERLARILTRAAGVATITVGVFWLLR
jgi:sulfite exporter TauE/SafE